MGAMTPSKKLDVLIVDDDPATRVLLGRAVRDLGHDARTAEDGDAALKTLRTRAPDVVITDWEMPGMTGAELCKRIRDEQEDEAPYTYVILMTGHGDADRLRDGMKAGADDYQKKPIELDELEARLVSAARVVSLHGRLAERTKELRRDSRRFYALSRTDALTGAGNRLALHEEIEQLRARAARYGHRYSIAMADVDLFKRYNDAFGHIAGDDVLRRVTETIKGQIRTSDALYRYGGEEFAIVLAEQSLDLAVPAIERVRRAIEALAIAAPDGGVLTVSFGVAELGPDDTTAEDCLKRADAALYRAKEHGRNRVESATPLSTPQCGTEHEEPLAHQGGI